MKQKLTPRWLIIKLTGLFFAMYSAYNIFIIVRDIGSLNFEGKLISALVALLFAVLTVYAWTSEVKDILFRLIRKWVMIFVLIAVFALKLRMVNKVIDYIDFSKLHTILFGGAYFLTQAALLILFVYYAFFRKMIPLHPKAAIVLPLSAMILFLCSLVLEMILFLYYGIGTETNLLRTAVSRPLFYLGFIGLSAYFLYPPQIQNKK